jgi:hypothetical protein
MIVAAVEDGPYYCFIIDPEPRFLVPPVAAKKAPARINGVARMKALERRAGF